MDLGLKGKVALVTGSTHGIGHAIARRLAEEGARVILNGRTASRLDQAAVELRAAGKFAADTSDPKACIAMMEYVAREHGALDVLVCNVGSGASVPPGTETREEWQRMLDINLHSATNAVSAATPLLARSRGVVVCISSICGLEALGAPIAYAAAKAALNSYVRGAARPLAKEGVRINAIAPGNILFPGSVWERKMKEAPEQVEAMLARDVALGRLGSAEEVADLAAFLASARSGFATGAVYVLDGGQVRS